MLTLLAILALLGVALFLYSYLLYPLLLAMVAGIVQFRRDVAFALAKSERRPGGETAWPKVAVVIAAYNEQKHIAQRVRNLLALDYPADCLSIYIGSDGSRDDTAAILQQFADPRLHVFLFEENRGKANVLNDLVSRGREELIVFSDANTFFATDALKHLIQPFQDEAVGCVSGELHLLSSGGNNQDGLYWRVEQFLKFFESRIGGALGANGAIYAIRRKFWTQLPPDTICDDFCIAMNVAAFGGRIVYTPNARAEEEMPESIGDEYQRRIRIGIGNFQALFRSPRYFLSTSWGTRWAYVSHKVLRWLAPHLLLLSMAASFWLACLSSVWWWWVLLQTLGLAVAVVAYVMQGKGLGLPSVLNLLAFLFALNFAFIIASWRYVSGSYSGSWRRTSR
ncbi:glycosyltransferase family 2 protein [Aquabacterium sp. NJ1]|uniref:glycosyltransferase family 2 protein n=1 Tax=Aquabacterium sp. NJ1 TaxID=1538295 RepID=UPI0009DF5FA6|nr:glycosyltransferase family 2 protein [Aquabacterium sp. NJ1]